MYRYGYHRELHVLTLSFPTRRSSYLACSKTGAHRSLRTPDGEHCHRGGADPHRLALNCRRPTRLRSRVSGSSIELRGIEPGHRIRSEEHTSELKSLMRT